MNSLEGVKQQCYPFHHRDTCVFLYKEMDVVAISKNLNATDLLSFTTKLLVCQNVCITVWNIN